MWCQYKELGKNGDASSVTSQFDTKKSQIQEEVDWGMSYRRQKIKESREHKVLHPSPPPVDIPFKICRAECMKLKKKKKKRKRSLKKACEEKNKRRKYTLLELSTMSQHKYMRYLSRPNPKMKEEPRQKVKPRCCCCDLEPCPPRIIQLARPNKHLVYSLWVTKGHILSAEVIERLQNILYSSQNLEPRDARYYFKRLDKMKRKILRKKRLEAMKRRQNKLRRDQCWLRCQIRALCQAIVKHIRSVPLFTLNYKQLILSEQTLTFLDARGILKKPSRNSKKPFNTACIEISDKLAFWMDTIIKFVDCQQIETQLDIPPLDLASLGEEEEECETLYIETESSSSSDYDTDSELDSKLGGIDMDMEEGEYEYRDSLKKLIQIMKKSGDEFLKEPANEETMGDFTNGEVLEMVEDFEEGKIEGYDGKAVLEPVLTQWVEQNEPEVLDDAMMEAIHDTSEALKDDFLREYRSSKESKAGDDKPDDNDDKKGSDSGKKDGDEDDNDGGGKDEDGKDDGDDDHKKDDDDKKDDDQNEDGGDEGGANKTEEEAKQAEDDKENVENKNEEQKAEEGEDQGDGQQPDGSPNNEPKEVEEPAFTKKKVFDLLSKKDDNKQGDLNENQNSNINEDQLKEDKAVGEVQTSDNDKGHDDDKELGDRLKDDSTQMTPLRGMKHAKIGQTLTVGEKAANTDYEYSQRSDKSVEGGQYVGGDFNKSRDGDRESRDKDQQQIGRLEGDVIKDQKPIKVYEHQKGTICCLSLKFWAVWLMEITNNAHNWTKWMAKVIQKVRYFVSVIHGDVSLANGQKKKLDKFEWAQFVKETESMITAWRQYSAHVEDLTKDIIENYSNKTVKCCSRCVQDMRIKNICNAHDTLRSLTDAMGCVGYWRHALDDLVEVTKKLTNLNISDSDSASSSGSDGCGCPGDAVIEEVSSTCVPYQRPENVPKEESYYELQVLKEELHQEPVRPRKSRKKSRDSKDSGKKDAKNKDKKKAGEKAKTGAKKK